MKDFRPAKKRVDVSVGESVRILRELQRLSQNQLAELSAVPQATLSAIENDRVRLGVERAKVLARALRCHPAVLVFPSWELPVETAAYPVAQHGRPPVGFRPRVGRRLACCVRRSIDYVHCGTNLTQLGGPACA